MSFSRTAGGKADAPVASWLRCLLCNFLTFALLHQFGHGNMIGNFLCNLVRKNQDGTRKCTIILTFFWAHSVFASGSTRSTASSLRIRAGPIGLTIRMRCQELTGQCWPFVFMGSIVPEHLPAYEFPGGDAWRY